jgi:hypothetical protein
LPEVLPVDEHPSTKNPEEIAFWRREAREAASELVKRIDELRNHVTVTSKSASFYVYFHWRDLDERGYYQLELALCGILWYHKEWLLADNLNQYLLNNLIEEVGRNEKRFRRTKFFWFFSLSIGFLVSDKWLEYKGYQLPPIREYLGNYKMNPGKLFGRIYSVRTESRKRLKRKVFRRGYDDKGSESSVSDRARKDANRGEFPYLTADFLEWLRKSDDPLKVLRQLGYLLPKEE